MYFICIFKSIYGFRLFLGEKYVLNKLNLDFIRTKILRQIKVPSCSGESC